MDSKGEGNLYLDNAGNSLICAAYRELSLYRAFPRDLSHEPSADGRDAS